MRTNDLLDHGKLAGSDLEHEIASGKFILQEDNRPDHEYPEVVWNQYGIVPANQVAITARCGELAYYARQPSYLAYPYMADRLFGTDVLDIQLGHELADQLWTRYGHQLREQALRLRSVRDG